MEGLDLGEGYSALLLEGDGAEGGDAPPPPPPPPLPPLPRTSSPHSSRVPSEDNPENPLLPEQSPPRGAGNTAQGNSDVHSFLQTVDLAGVPSGMAIAFLNDAERQHALAHLRKQMMLSNPHDCMLCQAPFRSSADIRFCPCCAMVSCVSCVSRRVFEVVSRQVVSVCVHCCRESSRIRHPPEAVRDQRGIDAGVRGRWWRPEELGMVDYSQSFTPGGMAAGSVGVGGGGGGGVKIRSMAAEMQGAGREEKGDGARESSRRPSKPLLPGLLMGPMDLEGPEVRTKLPPPPLPSPNQKFTHLFANF